MRGHNFRSEHCMVLTQTFVEFSHIHFDTSFPSIDNKIIVNVSTDLGKMTESAENCRLQRSGNYKVSSLHLPAIDPIDPFKLALVIQPYWSLQLRVDSRDPQTSNVSIWRYHCLGEVACPKIWNQYWLPSDAVDQRFLFISHAHLQSTLESTLVPGQISEGYSIAACMANLLSNYIRVIFSNFWICTISYKSVSNVVNVKVCVNCVTVQ